MLSGNTQQIILERAEWAVAEGTPQALQAYVDDLRLLLEQRRDDMHMVQVSSCIHRLGRIANTVSSVRLPPFTVSSFVPFFAALACAAFLIGALLSFPG